MGSSGGVGEWVRNGQHRGNASSVSSTATIIRGSRGINRERARSTPSRGEGEVFERNWGRIEAQIKEAMALIETRIVSITERGHEELKEAVEASLTLIQT